MSQRGLSLFNNTFDNPAEKQVAAPSLNQRKRECIIDYFYYTGRSNPKFSYTAVLGECSEAFFLSSITIYDILQENADKLLLIKQENKDTKVEKLQKVFSAKWPRMVW